MPHYLYFCIQKVTVLRFMSFGSGSCGNCYYLGADKYGILIDAGIGIRKMKKYFSEYGFSFNDIRHILVTHDHADHVKAVGAISTTYDIPVYATERVHEGIVRNYCVRKKIALSNVRKINPGESFSLGDFTVSAFHVPHDSFDNVGYKITYGDVVFCLMTDVGHVTEEMSHFIGDADYLVIESNYDDEMLWAGPYPDYLKKRVSGGNGHLSNKLCAKAIIDNASDRLRHVWLCHLSQENNHPELARKTVEFELKSSGNVNVAELPVDVLKRNIPSNVYEL